MRRRTIAIAGAALLGAMLHETAADDPGYGPYRDWLGWARLSLEQRAGLASSYDRSGGNYDFNQYEYPPGLIFPEMTCTVRTLTGPGVITRFWMPHISADRRFVVRMYFDDEPTPRIDTTSDVVFAGQHAYFSAPFVTTFAGGQISYEPIPFARSLRIETVNQLLPPEIFTSDRHFYQYTYKLLPPTAALASYDGGLTPAQQAARQAAAAVLANVGQHPAGSSPTALSVSTTASTVPAGQSKLLFSGVGPGVVRSVHLSMPGASDAALEALHLVVTYDDELAAAIDASVAYLFGAGRQRAVYRSLPLGTDSPEGFYCYWPMPFRRAISIALRNDGADPIDFDTARIEYEPGPLDSGACYLRVHVEHNVRSSGQTLHPVLVAGGRGHFVGSLLYLEEDRYGFVMLEGDEIINVDGTDVQFGTGLEDAFNGGYYYNWVGAIASEPEGPMPRSAIRPLHGILHVHRSPGVEYGRADQYRWYIADRIPFRRSIDVRFENRYAAVGSRWTSVAYWYSWPRIPGDMDNDGAVNVRDLPPFVTTLLGMNPAGAAAADMNGDGAADGIDVGPFVEAVLRP